MGLAPRMVPANDVTLAIIAGGAGRRLGGVAKGLCVVEGSTLLERLLRLRPLVAEVFLVANDASPYQPWALRVVKDVVPGRGGPGGVHAALVASRTEWVLAVACDMPFVSPEVVSALLAHRSPEVDVVCFRQAGRLEPLCALYRKGLAGAFEAALPQGPSFRDLLPTLRTRALPEDQLARVDPTGRALRSVNTPEDARQLSVEVPE